MWGILKEVKCRLCEKYCKQKNMEAPNSVDSVGRIQCYCPALQLPRIAIQHGIGRELLFSIRKCSTQLDDEKEPTWHFPSALSPEAHAEWGLYKILEYMGLHEKPPMGNGHNRAKLHKDIEESHIAYNVNFVADLLSTFLSRRPDGLAFDKGKKRLYSWNSPEQWTKTKAGPQRTKWRKTKDTALISALSITSAEGEKRLESHIDKLRDGSARIPPHQPVYDQTELTTDKKDTM